IDAHRFDSYDRKGPKIFVGEWASWNTAAPWEQRRGDGPTSALRGALADAAWLTGVERNSDIVIMASYAPMFVNVNPGARQWSIDLIGYNALSSFGSPSYYVQTMFDADHGDVVLPSTLTGDQLFESATRDTKTGAVFIKLVNISAAAQSVQITLSGTSSVSNQASATTLSGTSLEDVNTLDQPTLIAPITKTVPGIGRDFTYVIAPYCVSVLKINAS
ncbi:MAG TPA: alpha-L-arabinofuranosidase C-terminal domain-containing protein, partial [Capsulimonadaceae bacterium]|nr:alpha-L-arabinofuranosidase C-terminal domain-containing protein [Capsulimonadaceae bacterium]